MHSLFSGIFASHFVGFRLEMRGSKSHVPMPRRAGWAKYPSSGGRSHAALPPNSRRMETASSAARGDELETRHLLRDGKLLAVLRTLHHGGAFTVVAEFVGTDAEGAEATRIRPYAFAHAAEATAFFAEAVESFAYLGCDVQ